ncbi:MAG: methylenetetrahydrofolate reductase [Oscillospiraceae bacterium]|jgi:methylenetetrahydrofolate reductase (NADPH)|nr:methylenetetrahydrofolate reductase [Oscillospiraceae bacterium]
MKILDILRSGAVTVSCELFPPKQGAELEKAKTLVEEIAALSPSFISVTYGAGGRSGGHTIELAKQAQNAGVPALAHVTCVGAQRSDVLTTLDNLRAQGIENILALRGDMPSDGEISADGYYRHASELMAEIRDYGGFCVGGACYPEGHPESQTLWEDIDHLKEKVDSGCSFLTTQMFFDNTILYNYMFRLMKSGITVPVVAGIMPVTNGKQIARICKLSGTALPPRFRAIVDKFGADPAAMNQAGLAYATEQIIDLIANGVRNIHIYTMNKPYIAGGIMHNLSEIIK